MPDGFDFELEESKIYLCKRIWPMILLSYILLTLEKYVLINKDILIVSFY